RARLRGCPRRLDVTPEELTGEVTSEQRTRSLEVLDAMMMIRLEQYEQAEDRLRGWWRGAGADADAERRGECSEGLGRTAPRRGRASHALELFQQALDV